MRVGRTGRRTLGNPEHEVWDSSENPGGLEKTHIFDRYSIRWNQTCTDEWCPWHDPSVVCLVAWHWLILHFCINESETCHHFSPAALQYVYAAMISRAQRFVSFRGGGARNLASQDFPVFVARSSRKCDGDSLEPAFVLERNQVAKATSRGHRDTRLQQTTHSRHKRLSKVCLAKFHQVCFMLTGPV